MGGEGPCHLSPPRLVSSIHPCLENSLTVICENIGNMSDRPDSRLRQPFSLTAPQRAVADSPTDTPLIRISSPKEGLFARLSRYGPGSMFFVAGRGSDTVLRTRGRNPGGPDPSFLPWHAWAAWWAAIVES